VRGTRLLSAGEGERGAALDDPTQITSEQPLGSRLLTTHHHHHHTTPHHHLQVAVVLGVAPCIPGMLPALGLSPTPASPFFAAVYDGAWFVGAGISSCLYTLMMVAGGSSGAVDSPRGGTSGGGGGGGGAPAPA